MQALFIERKDIDTQAWDNLVDHSEQGSIFVQTQYLDVLLDKNWQAVIVTDNNILRAVMPLKLSKKLGFHFALQPLFTKYWGLCFARMTFKNTYEEYSWKRKVIDAAISGLPEGLAGFEYNFHPSFDYALPFYWKKFDLSLRYSFRLDLTQPLQQLFNDLKPNSRRLVQDAEAKAIEIKENAATARDVTDLFKKNEDAGKKILDSASFPLMEKLVAKGRELGFLFTRSIHNERNKIVCCAVYIHDKHCTYLLAQLVDPAYKGMDVNTYLIYNGIIHARSLTPAFDFLGSMIEGIEGFNRRFGAKPVPYITISRYYKLVKLFK